MEELNLNEITGGIVSAFVSHNATSITDLPGLIKSTYAALAACGVTVTVDAPTTQEPAVSVRSSVKPDALTCLECGAKQKTLKRHLMSSHGLSPEQYRAKWKLPAAYPMVAPNYAATRRDLAIAIGLGKSRKAK
jgi:predicted transcriptional regulator